LQDFGKDFKKCRPLSAALRDVQKILLVIGDSAHIRAKLQEQQQLKYIGKTKAIPTHCPTHWGIIFFIAKSIFESKVMGQLCLCMKV
jgi:hypothetical protein